MALTSEHRVEALGADAPGNAQQVVVKVAAAAVEHRTSREADYQFEGEMAAGDRDPRTDQRLDLVQVGA